MIAAGVVFDAMQQGLLNGLEDKERLNFLWDLRFGLLNLDVGFNGVLLPLRNIELSKPIHYDGLTKQIFLEKMDKVKRAVIFTLWTFDRKFGAPAQKTDLMVR